MAIEIDVNNGSVTTVTENVQTESVINVYILKEIHFEANIDGKSSKCGYIIFNTRGNYRHVMNMIKY